jgi:N-methylhydantoinase B/oxoprolinase/acetone carboxylase alpha subunit
VEKVREEVKNGMISIDAAKNVYGVAIDSESFNINWDDTKKLRKQN